jgi:hypothetical protein
LLTLVVTVGPSAASTNCTNDPAEFGATTLLDATPGCRNDCMPAGIENSTRHAPRTSAPLRV